MKKITVLLSILIASINAFAVVTTTSQITLSSANQGDKILQIVVASQFSDADDYSYDAVVGANQDGGLYIINNSQRYTKFAIDALPANLPMGFGAVEDLSYTLSFQYFTGTSFTIYDAVAQQTITVDNQTEDYNFTINASEMNTAINDRFIINYQAAPQPTGYTVTLNSFGMATFSAAEKTLVPAGLKVYTAGNLSGNELSLSLAAEAGDVIPAGKGVLLFGEEGEYTMAISDNDATNLGNNMFHASSEWANSDKENVYILHGNELWLYNGAEFKENKAYLQIHMPAGESYAPARISMRFDAATGIEDVEAAVKAEKFVRDGQVLIRRGEVVYNLQGQVVK